MGKKDYYAILNVDHKAPLKAIKSAYRQLALKYHPDHNPNNPEALAQFALIREAYETLTSPELKKAYDFEYRPQPEVSVQRHPETDLSGKKAGKNLRYNLYVTLEEVARGGERSIRFIRQNKKVKETVQLKVSIPRGAFHHQRLKLSNYGDVDGNTAGDLFIIIHLQNHPIFLKNGLDLRVNVPISYLDALLGTSISVPTLIGVKEVKLRSCDFDRLEYTLKGMGLPDHQSSTHGDIIVHCFIDNPIKMSTAEKNALQKILKTWPQGEMMQQYQSYINEAGRR